jgi:hypothetical protein
VRWWRALGPSTKELDPSAYADARLRMPVGH